MEEGEGKVGVGGHDTGSGEGGEKVGVAGAGKWLVVRCHRG